MLGLVLLIIIIVAYFYSINAFMKLATEKGHVDKTGRVLAIALLGTPILAALYVIALPDNKLAERLESMHAAILSIDADNMRAQEHQEAKEMLEKQQEAKNSIS